MGRQRIGERGCGEIKDVWIQRIGGKKYEKQKKWGLKKRENDGEGQMRYRIVARHVSAFLEQIDPLLIQGCVW